MTQLSHIGLFTPGWPGQNTPNGIATSVYNLVLGLHEIGLKPVVLAKRIDGPCPADIPVIPMPQLKWRMRDRLSVKLGNPDASHWHIARNIAAAIKEANSQYALDAVIMEETNGWAGMVQQLVPIPIIITLHGPSVLLQPFQHKNPAKTNRQREKREARAIAMASGLISPSHNVLETIGKIVSLTNTPKIVLPNTYLSETPAHLSATLQPPDVLFVGRFDNLKGADTVFDAFARLSVTHPQARLTFVGPDIGVRREDGSVTNIEATLADLPDAVRARITYTGPADREEVARLRASHAIALIASRYENLNYTLLEAMAAGQAIVCTEVGGPAEVLENEQTALLVPPGDPDAMAKALGRLIDDAALCRHLGETAHAKLASDFNPGRVATQTGAFVESVVKNCEPK